MFPPTRFREKRYNRALGREGLFLGTGWFPDQQGHLAELWEQGVWGENRLPLPQPAPATPAHQEGCRPSAGLPRDSELTGEKMVALEEQNIVKEDRKLRSFTRQSKNTMGKYSLV